MKKFLLCSLVCLCSYPVLAQNNGAITIIGDDGTKQVVPIAVSPSDSSANPTPKSVVRLPKVERSLNVVPREALTASPPDIVPQQGDENPPKPTAKPAIKKAAKQKPVAGEKRVSDAYKPVQIPPKKPYRPEGRVVNTGAPISKSDAISIALSEAPPARDVEVVPVEDEKGLMYSITFKGDESDYEVLVDALTREILRSGVVKNDRAQVEPGHLPIQ